jgi:uncharacterized damage-inducible protein DinB
MLAALFAFSTMPALAQTPVLTADLVKDITQAEEKFVALANALSAEQYQWRPAQGVRSVQEVLLHVAADNYFIPAAMGIAAPAETKITATDFQPVMAFEKQSLDRAGTVAALQASFHHLRRALNGISEARLNETIKVFGQDFTVRQFMLLTATHMHEHLGQLIAYARTNGVKPPWSR